MCQLSRYKKAELEMRQRSNLMTFYTHRYNIPYIIQYFLHNIASVDCKWGAWRDPGACSKSCGGGTRSKVRVKLVEEKNGGQCIGKSIVFELCNMNSCPGKISDHIHLFL